MNIDYLREFLELGKTLSLTKTASKMHSTQTTLTKHLQSMEREAGATLALRDTTMMELTEEGRVLWNAASVIVREYDSALDEMARINQEAPLRTVVVGGNLRCRTLSDFLIASSSLIRAEGRNLRIEQSAYRAAVPTPDLTPPSLSGPLSEGAVDTFLLYDFDMGEDDREAIEVAPLFREKIKVMINVGHPYAKSGSITVEQLVESFEIVVMATGMNTWARVLQICRQAGSSNPRVKIRMCRSFDDAFLRGSMDEAMCFSEADAARIAPPQISGLVPIDLTGDEAYLETCAMYLKSGSNPAVADLVAALQATAKKLDVASS